MKTGKNFKFIFQFSIKNKKVIRKAIMTAFYQKTKLTKISNLDINKIVLDKPQVGSVPGQKLSYQRINIGIKNGDGTVGELIIPTPKVFSFGVQENIDDATGQLNGYTMPLSLWSRTGATVEELAFSKAFDSVIQKCKELLFDIKESFGHSDLMMSDLRKITGVFRKVGSDGKIDPNSPPTLYCKLIYSKKDKKILTDFHDVYGKTINPLDLMGKYCTATCGIKIESFFIGSGKYSIQIKLYEASVTLSTTGMMRLLDIEDSPSGDDEENTTTPNPVIKSESKKIEISNDESESESESDDESVTSKLPVKSVAPLTTRKQPVNGNSKK